MYREPGSMNGEQPANVNPCLGPEISGERQLSKVRN